MMLVYLARFFVPKKLESGATLDVQAHLTSTILSMRSMDQTKKWWKRSHRFLLDTLTVDVDAGLA